MTIYEQLAAFIAGSDARPWEPGTVDCCIVLADWSMWLGYDDPAPHLRGIYDSEDGFRAIIAARGGVVPVVATCAANIGLKPTDRPRCGDIGAIGSHTNIERQFGAIHDGSGWLVRMHEGFERMTARTLAAWAVMPDSIYDDVILEQELDDQSRPTLSRWRPG